MYEKLYRVIDWLLESPIHNANAEAAIKSSFNLLYDSKKNSYVVPHSEITAYAVSACVNLYQWHGDDRYLEVAKDAAKFILKMQSSNSNFRGAISFGYDTKTAEKSSEYFSFDTGICVRALSQLYRVVQNGDYLNSGIMAADWLINKAQNEDGSFKAMYNKTSSKFNDKKYLNTFWNDRSCLHSKISMALLDSYEFKRDAHYKQGAIKVCDWVLKLQNEDGSFRISEDDARVYTHTNCYAAEGLLFSYWKIKDNRYLDAAKRLADWLLRHQNKDGSLFWGYKERGLKNLVFRSKATGPLAQAIRIWLILYYITKNNKYLQGAQKAQRFIETTYFYDKNSRKFLFYSIVKNSFKIRYRSPYISSWANMFILQALYELEHFQRKNAFDEMMEELH